MASVGIVHQSSTYALHPNKQAGKTPQKRLYRVEQKNLAKFSDKCYVRADGLCIGSLRLVDGGKRENSNMQEIFCTILYKC